MMRVIGKAAFVLLSLAISLALAECATPTSGSGITVLYELDKGTVAANANDGALIDQAAEVMRKRLADISPSHVERRGSQIAIWMSESVAGVTAADIDRIAGRGVLDFRMVITRSELGENDGAEYQAASQNLRQQGPTQPLKVLGSAARWFEIDSSFKENFTHGPFAMESQNGKAYLLCYDDLLHSMTHTDLRRKPWSVRVGGPQSNPGLQGGISLPFTLDAVGAKYMGDLTSFNKGHAMAILLDDKAMTAPTIQSQVNESGQITYGMPSATHTIADIKKEAGMLKQAVNSGSMPFPLRRVPAVAASGPAKP